MHDGSLTCMDNAANRFNPDEAAATPTTDDDDFKIKGAARRALKSGKASAPEDCTICLQTITERAIAVPCNHLTFDFICLVSWLQQRKTCPLCNATITAVEYDWRGPHDYKVFEVQSTEREPRRVDDSASQRMRLRSHRDSRGPINQSRPSSLPLRTHEDPALSRRRRAYQHRLYSQHIGANAISGYRDFTPKDFAGSTSLQTRARIFLRRELQLFTHLDSDRGVRNRDFVLEYVVAVLRKFDPKGADGQAENFLAEFLDRANARLLLHELHAWLRSPFATLEGWDQSVQYATGTEKSLPAANDAG